MNLKRLNLLYGGINQAENDTKNLRGVALAIEALIKVAKLQNMAGKNAAIMISDFLKEFDVITPESFIKPEPCDSTKQEDPRDPAYWEDPLQKQIESFINKPVPEDWFKWSLNKRRLFWAGGNVADNLNLVPRDRICVLEIWRECLCDPQSTIPRLESFRISKILESMQGWRHGGAMRFGPDYGTQKGFKRILSLHD